MTQPYVSRRRRWAILGAMCLALAAVIAAVASLNVALPGIARDTGATQGELQWMVDGYALVFAALLLPAGALGDRYGRRRVIIAGLILFAAPCFLALATKDPLTIISLRTFAGVGAALTMPVTLSVITDVFPEDERDKAVGLWAGVTGAGGMIGLVACGALLEYFSWRSVFVFNGGFALVALAAVLAVAPRTKGVDTAPNDFVGGILNAAGLGALVYGITEGPARGWGDALVVLGFAGGLALVAAFVAWELRARHPLLDPRLFRVRGFAAGALSLTVLFAVVFGFFYVFVQYLQWVAGYTPLQAGLALAPMGAMLMAASPIAAVLSRQHGMRPVVTGGLVLMAAGMLLVSRLDAASGYTDSAIAMVVLGLGLGAGMAPGTSAIISAVPAAKRGVASAVNDATREVGAAIGIALFGSMLNAGYRQSVSGATDGLSAEAAAAVRGSIAAAADIAASQPDGALIIAARDAFVAGMERSMVAGAIVIALAAVATAIIAPGARPRSPTLPDAIPATEEP